MSAVGHCCDSAACEGFLGLLKRERIYRTNYRTLDAARADVFGYIERRHNPRMRRRVAKQDPKIAALFRTVRDIGVEPHQSPQSCARQLFRVECLLDDLPSQGPLEIDGNALAEGPVTGGGPDEMMRDAHWEMRPDLSPAPDLSFSPKSNASH
jgi:hypothetical protein